MGSNMASLDNLKGNWRISWEAKDYTSFTLSADSASRALGLDNMDKSCPEPWQTNISYIPCKTWHSLRCRRLKKRERGFWTRRKHEGRARREGGRETPARKPLFWPSRLLIMYAKITQQWMTSCQISLAVMHLFKFLFHVLYFFCFSKKRNLNWRYY